MKLSDLTAAERRQIRTGGARAVTVRPVVHRSRPTGATTGRTPSHRCGRCGQTFGSYPKAEAHADEQHTGATRIACELED